MVIRKSVPWHNVRAVKALAPEGQLVAFVDNLSALQRRMLRRILKSFLAKKQKLTRKRAKKSRKALKTK
jgi:hypothetical protein